MNGKTLAYIIGEHNFIFYKKFVDLLDKIEKINGSSFEDLKDFNPQDFVDAETHLQ